MEKEFVPYTEALELKELGFDEPCFGYYVDGELRGVNLGIEQLGGIEPYYQRFGFHTLSNHNIDNPNKIVATSPTFSQAFRWFREKYNLDGSMSVDVWNKKTTSYRITGGIVGVVEASSYGHLYDIDSRDYNTYEETELACLKKLIEIVKEK